MTAKYDTDLKLHFFSPKILKLRSVQLTQGFNSEKKNRLQQRFLRPGKVTLRTKEDLIPAKQVLKKENVVSISTPFKIQVTGY
jgi:hypothetical protein